MAESFNPIEYIEYLRKRWKFTAVAVILAGALAVSACLLLPKQYTATATLVIEPPAGDPRATTAVSSIYLESLKSYEAMASGNTLFAKACERFGLLDGKSGSSLESFKRRVLKIDKPKDTNVLELNVTLPNPTQAQELVQYLAEETVTLDRVTTHSEDRELLDGSQSQMDAAQKELDQARADESAASASDPTLESEVLALEDRKGLVEEQRIDANRNAAEGAARGDQEWAASNRAGFTALTAEIGAIQRDLAPKSAALASLRARQQRAHDRLHSAEESFERAAKHREEVTNTVTFHTEQLRIVDPGIVPQSPSSPNLPLATIAAVAIAGMMSLVWLTLQFGLSRRGDQPARAGLRVASSGGR